MSAEILGLDPGSLSTLEQLTLQREMLDASVDCIKVIDLEGRLTQMNRSGCLALGVSEEQAAAGFGMAWLSLLPPEIRVRGRRALKRAREGHKARFDGRSDLSDGSSIHWDNILTPLVNDSGAVTAILCVSRDITLQREAERRLRTASETDALTGLLNRRTFRTRLTRALSRATRDGAEVTAFLIDLDDFKVVNDTLGHIAGDHLLRTVSDRIADCLPPAAHLARLGGDEFAIFLESGPRSASASAGTAADSIDRTAAALATAIAARCEEPIVFDGREMNAAMTIGWASFPRDAGDESELISHADIALNHAKSTGRGGRQAFNHQLRRRAVVAAEQVTLAREVLKRDALVPVYQPKIRLSDGVLTGFEALLRWRTPDGDLALPELIAGAYDHHELAFQLASDLQDKVIEDLAGWRDAELPVVPVAINAAPIELLRPEYPTALLARLRAHRLPPGLIEVEVSENTLVERGAGTAFSALSSLQSHGISVALDDFGTGRSSLTAVRDYPADTIKIDRSFITGLVTDPSSQAIVTAIAGIAAALDAEVVAEGVETEAQAELLRRAGCRTGQGHYFSGPLEAAEARAALATHRHYPVEAAS